jgi:hypothetical protein
MQKLAGASKPKLDANNPLYVQLQSGAGSADGMVAADTHVDLEPTTAQVRPMKRGLVRLHGHMPLGYRHGHVPTVNSTQTTVDRELSTSAGPPSAGAATPEPEPERPDESVRVAAQPLRMTLGQTVSVGSRSLLTSRLLIAVMKKFEQADAGANFTAGQLSAATGADCAQVLACVKSAVLRQCVGTARNYTHDVFELVGSAADPVIMLSDSSANVVLRCAKGQKPQGYTFVCQA